MKKTKLMAILNVTPNSFACKCPDPEEAIQQGIEMYKAGADLIDIGGESTAPGAPHVDEKEELNRIIPVIKALRKQIPIPISIDTSKPAVAAAALEVGASIINDIYGFQNPTMREVAIHSHADLCIMHMQGTPQTMQLNPQYPEGVVPHICHWLEMQANLLIREGVQPERIFLDPGIGFGKTVAHNLEILQNLAQLKKIGFSLLLGISRKSFMGKILDKKASELLSATLAMNSYLILSQVDVIRVHDVKEHRDAIDLLQLAKFTYQIR